MTMGLGKKIKKIYEPKHHEEKSVRSIQFKEAVKDITHKYNENKKLLEVWRNWRRAVGKSISKETEDPGMVLVPKDIFENSALHKLVDVEKLVFIKSRDKIDMDYEISRVVLRHWREMKMKELRHDYELKKNGFSHEQERPPAPLGRKHDHKPHVKEPEVSKRHSHPVRVPSLPTYRKKRSSLTTKQ